MNEHQRERLERFQNLARAKGGECLSAAYVNVAVHLRWRCRCGYEWMATPDNVRNGCWCPRCAGRLGPTVAELAELARSRGGVFLSTEILNSHTRLRWRCAEGHEWEAVANSVRGGTWCPTCAGNAALTLDYLREFAAELGGECLAEKYRNNQQKVRWRCSMGHEWEREVSKVLARRSWCPNCSGRKRTREELERAAAARGGEYVGADPPRSGEKERWRCVRGHVFEATPWDVLNRGTWCKTCGCAPPHTLDEMKLLARRHGGECLSLAYAGARVKLLFQCRGGHVFHASPTTILKERWCPQCRSQPGWNGIQLGIEDMQETAAARGGKCLSARYRGSEQKLLWECASGHRWRANPGSVRYGTWCPTCSRAIPGSIGMMRALAAQRGGLCLSRSYPSGSQVLAWRCADGHRFEATGVAVKSGMWCPECSKA